MQKYSAIFQDEDDQKPETKAEETEEKVEKPEEPEQYDPENESESNQEAPNQDFSGRITFCYLQNQIFSL